MSACLKSPASSRVRSAPQSGAVLIMALLIVSVVAGLAVKFTGDFQLGMARAESRWHGAQASAYLQGAENLAMYLLKDDDASVDHLGEDWAYEAPPFEVEGGWILASVEDAASRLDINTLLANFDPDKGHNDPERFTTPQRRFIRLLQTFQEEGVPLNEDEAIAVLEAVVDWMDHDNETSGFSGAEGDYYQSLDPAYLPANNFFVSVDELRLVRYMTPELMELLRPYLIAMPKAQGQAPSQGLNINTLPSKLLATITAKERLQPLTEMELGLLQQEWPEDGFFSSVGDFAGSPAWQSIGQTPNTDSLGISTSYFLVTAQVSLVQQRRTMLSLLQRGTDSLEVVRRSDSY